MGLKLMGDEAAGQSRTRAVNYEPASYPFRPVIEMPSTKVRWTKK